MTYDEYIKRLDRIKANAENDILSNISSIEDDALDALMVWFDDNLEMKGGQLIATDETIKLLNNFDSSYLEIMQQLQSYNGAVTSYLKRLPAMGNTVAEFQKSFSKIDVVKANVGDAQKLVVNEIINAYTDNGLNQNFVQPLRDLLYQNIAAGTRVQDAKSSLKEYVIGGEDKSGKLNRYLTQTAQQGVDSYTGMINKKLMDTFGFDGMLVSGSIIATSAPQCRYCINVLNGELSEKQWNNKVKKMAENNGLIDGTTFKNLPFNKMHFACRHEFTPVFLNK